MPITHIPSPIQELLTKFGVTLGDTLAGGKKNRRLEALQNDPDQAQRLVLAARAAERGGKFSSFSEGLGIDEEDARTLFLEGLQPTAEQSIQEQFLLGGGAQTAAQSQISQDILAGMSADEAIRNQVPMFEAVARAQGAEFDAENAEYQLGLLRYRADTGIDYAAVDATLRDIGLREEAAAGFKDYFQNLPEDSEERRFIEAGLTDPATGNLLMQLRQQDLSAALRMATLRGTQGSEKLALSLEVMDRMNAAVDRLAEAEEEGRDDDFIDQAKLDVENMRLLTQNLIETGSVEPFALTGAEGKSGKVELTFHDIQSSNLDAISREANMMVEGKSFRRNAAGEVVRDEEGNPIIDDVEPATAEDIQAEIQAAIESGLLSPAEREALETQSQSFLEQIQEREEAERGTVLGGIGGMLRESARTAAETPFVRGGDLSAGVIIGETMDLINRLGGFFQETGEMIRAQDPRRTGPGGR